MYINQLTDGTINLTAPVLIPYARDCDYSNGLRFPGDTDGPIEEWINCRCSNAPYVLPYGYAAPPQQQFRENDLIKIK